MPKIINAYSSQNTLADSLRDLGDSMFGDQARQEVYRQTGRKAKRENDSIEPFAAAARDGRRNDMAYYGALANKTGADAANYTLLGTANHARGVDDPGLATAQMGAGHGISSTAVGQGREIAQRAAAAHEATTRAAQVQEAIAARALVAQDAQAARESAAQDARMRAQREADERKNENTPVTTYEGGVPTIRRQSEAYGRPGAPLHKDQVVGGILQNAVRPPQAPPGPDSAAVPPGQSVPSEPPAAAPTASPFTNLPPDIRHLAGLPTGVSQYWDPHTRHVYTSADGGQTVDMAGVRIPVHGSRLQPIDNGQAIVQTQDNQVREQAGAGLPAAPTGFSQAAQDAHTTSGIKSPIQKEANATVGLFGGPEIGANTNRARENLNMLTQSTRELIASMPGRTGVQYQKWAGEIMAQPDGFFGMTSANADEARNKVVSFTQHLRRIYGDVQSEATDPNTPPADRQKLASYLRNLQRTIGAWEAPAAGAQQPAGGAPAPAQAAPQAAPAGDPLSQAREAIAKGADRGAVIRRLRQNGINPEGQL